VQRLVSQSCSYVILIYNNKLICISTLLNNIDKIIEQLDFIMISKIIKIFILQFSLVYAGLLPVHAVDLFEENFESGALILDDDIWKMNPNNYNPITQGKGDLLEVINTESHSGNFSLQYNYNGRNGICNTCSRSINFHKAGHDNATYFVSNSGEDLTDSSDFSKAAAAPGKFVYNSSDGGALWKVVSVETDTSLNDKLLLKLIKPGVGTSSRNNFKTGDKVEIARICGVDGFDRGVRNNCNRAGAFFKNDSIVGTQLAGESIFRRFYLLVQTPSVNTQTKLYFWFVNDAGTIKSIFLNLKTNNNYFPDYYPHIELTQVKATQPGSFWPGSTDGMPADTIFKRGLWYYVEEEYQASNPADAENGVYRLWLAEAGEEPSNEAGTNILEVQGLKLPSVNGTSLFGNISTTSHRFGFYYIDDIRISNAWNGPVTTGLRLPANKAASRPPIVVEP
jgi:hypothetical protein